MVPYRFLATSYAVAVQERMDSRRCICSCVQENYQRFLATSYAVAVQLRMLPTRAPSPAL